MRLCEFSNLQLLPSADYCCCCWSINGKYYELRTSEDEKEALLFRADEDPSKPSISIKDPEGLMFVRLLGGEGHCQCGGISEWHRVSGSPRFLIQFLSIFANIFQKIDVHLTPGETVGSIHYSNPSTMLMKDVEGEPLFRLTRQSPPIYSNPLKRAWTSGEDPKFQVFSTNPEFPEALTTICRKGRSYASYGQGWSIVMNFDDSLDLEAKALILGAAFPIVRFGILQNFFKKSFAK